MWVPGGMCGTVLRVAVRLTGAMLVGGPLGAAVLWLLRPEAGSDRQYFLVAMLIAAPITMAIAFVTVPLFLLVPLPLQKGVARSCAALLLFAVGVGAFAHVLLKIRGSGGISTLATSPILWLPPLLCLVLLPWLTVPWRSTERLGDCACGEDHSGGRARLLGIDCSASLKVTVRAVAVLSAAAPTGVLIGATSRHGISGVPPGGGLSVSVVAALLMAVLAASFVVPLLVLVPWHRLSPLGACLLLLIVSGSVGWLVSSGLAFDGQALVGPLSEDQFVVTWPLALCAATTPWILAPLDRRAVVRP